MGGELGAAYKLTENWKADATLAYAWGKNSSDGKALPQMPPLDARFGLTYSEDDWSAGALWRVVAAQNRIDQNKGNVVGKDYDKSAGFGVFSLNGAYRINKTQGQHRRRQPVRQGLRRAPEPGRQRRVRLPGQRPASHQRAGAHALDQGRHELLTENQKIAGSRRERVDPVGAAEAAI
jgi:outer membrane receptor protein involved in Fe transport